MLYKLIDNDLIGGMWFIGRTKGCRWTSVLTASSRSAGTPTSSSLRCLAGNAAIGASNE